MQIRFGMLLSDTCKGINFRPNILGKIVNMKSGQFVLCPPRVARWMNAEVANKLFVPETSFYFFGGYEDAYNVARSYFG